MRYTEDPTKATELVNSIDDALAQERADRTDERPHVSDLLYCLRASWRKRRIIESGIQTSRGEENNRLILLIGQALHTIVAKALGRQANKRLENDWLVGEADARLVKPKTATCGACLGVGSVGPYGSVCALCWGSGSVEDTSESFIEEFKTTRVGFGLDDPLKWPHYVEQVASYIVLAQDMGIGTLKAVLHVLHLTFSSGPRWYQPHPRQLKRESNDEYAEKLRVAIAEARALYEQKVADWIAEEGRHSNLRSWPLEFDQSEIDSWKKELKRRERIWASDTEPGVNENVPADKSGYSWTCGYCPFFFKRGGDCPGGIGRSSNFFPIDRLDGEIGVVGSDEEFDGEM